MKQELGDENEINSTLSNLGEVYTAQGNHDQAAEYLAKSLTLSEKRSDKAGLAQTLGNLGILSGLKGNHERALEYFQRNHSSRTGMPYGAASALRQATLKLLRSKHYDHPFYWAPFIVIGNGTGSRAM